MKRRIQINYFCLGYNRVCISHSNQIHNLYFEDKIDFSFIRKKFKAVVLGFIEDGNRAIKESKFFVNAVLFEDGKAIGFKNIEINFNQVLKWHD